MVRHVVGQEDLLGWCLGAASSTVAEEGEDENSDKDCRSTDGDANYGAHWEARLWFVVGNGAWRDGYC